MRQTDWQAQQAHLVRLAREAASMAAQARSRGRDAEAAELDARAKRLQAAAAQAASKAGTTRGRPWRAQRLPPRAAPRPDATIDSDRAQRRAAKAAAKRARKRARKLNDIPLPVSQTPKKRSMRDAEIGAQLDTWLNKIRVAHGEGSAKAFIGRVRSWLRNKQSGNAKPNRLTLYRDTWNQGAGGGGEGNGYSYRPDPTKETRIYVPRFLCGSEKNAPRTIVIEGLPPYDAAGARPRRERSRHG